MKMYVFEGSPEELSQVAKTLQVSAPSTGAVIPTEDSPVQETPPISDEGSKDEGVTVKFARRALKRRPLSDPLKAILRRLYEANDWVGTNELYEESGYRGQQFAGLMGAFGRRLANTPDYDKGASFFFFERNEETEAGKYRLPDTVREALELEGVV